MKIQIFKTQEEKDLEQDIKSMVAIIKVLPKDQRKAMINAVIGGRVTVLENTEIVQKKFTTVESEKVTETTTEKIQEATDLETKKAEWKNMEKHLDNKITFDFNASGNLNATSGKIDQAVEIIESMNPKPKCVKISKVPFGERKGLKTLFVNINSKYHGIPTNRNHTEALLKKIGFEAVMP